MTTESSRHGTRITVELIPGKHKEKVQHAS
jgi:hypothetical protein